MTLLLGLEDIATLNGPTGPNKGGLDLKTVESKNRGTVLFFSSAILFDCDFLEHYLFDRVFLVCDVLVCGAGPTWAKTAKSFSNRST